MVVVNDEEISSAILYLLENQKLVVEWAGALVAALMHDKINLRKYQKNCYYFKRW